MNLYKILEDLNYELLSENENIEIKNISYDSRRVTKGTLFICIKGYKYDGHDYINSAVNNGALAVIVERDELINPILKKKVTFIKVEDTRKALSKVASKFYGNPSSELKVIGITGTNGKTSVSYYISEILKLSGKKTGIIGTINNVCGDEILDIVRTTHTTPEAPQIQCMLRTMVEKGVEFVCIEATSMGLKLNRVDDCNFDIAVFTNLTRDHLDDHKTMENYKNCKKQLFRLSKFSVINLDDNVGREIINETTNGYITYGLNKYADIYAHDIKTTNQGTKFIMTYKGENKDVQIYIPGRFSVYNALAATGVCIRLGLKIDDIINGLASITNVKGRFETIKAENGSSIIVDYAHTPDALENVLKTAREFKKGKLILVFGCGGNRDKTKRPLMGKIASKLADLCIITSDNPREEDPQNIIKDIIKGMNNVNSECIIIEDRKKAIRFALTQANNNDIVIIAGKGHETYQEINGDVIPFDDCEIVKKYLKT
ncbi:UDP-N-acetylmuramoyl-L-alanyl-D-glutamate--2,6-diaminopimelate ligase [Abyssisolibacter fermentans]|uniref:UDP-N-acetylmuramoyl-L-alanyl-D-glutamate--2, 6-diaminopimelate ligase n=1 Tax=Abyssisolibacter fermentans TaxID=1766203 RepID=UPI00082AEFA4|nr:UDP-N-acetylmuramoyl-L-alanyl-D-glutamate--2,6-diaminopimelate ligase [Abyssisolibacter fermentans]